MSINILVIGDPHFRSGHLAEGRQLLKRTVKAAKKVDPDAIIVLGDILDTHEVAREGPFNMVWKFIDQLSQITHTFLLMGNHDLSSNIAYLSIKHFFNPYKKWPNVTIVDKPLVVQYKNFSFVLCPYVPPGRFIEALDTLGNVFDWKKATCIFAHQEFRNCTLKENEGEKVFSIVGDKWKKTYPPVISGHIHGEHCVAPNIYYPGSSMQINFDESPDKYVWHVTFYSQDADEPFDIEKIDLGIKSKKEITMSPEEAKKFDEKLLEKYYIKLRIKGSTEQIKLFRHSPQYKKLIERDVKIVFDPILDVATNPFLDNLKKASRERTTFDGILKELIKHKSKEAQEVYEELFNKN